MTCACTVDAHGTVTNLCSAHTEALRVLGTKPSEPFVSTKALRRLLEPWRDRLKGTREVVNDLEKFGQLLTINTVLDWLADKEKDWRQ